MPMAAAVRNRNAVETLYFRQHSAPIADSSQIRLFYARAEPFHVDNELTRCRQRSCSILRAHVQAAIA